MATHVNPSSRPSASELVRGMRARMAPRRERVLRNAALLRQIAAQRSGKRRD